MEASLRNRLTFGPMLLGGLIGLLVLDYYVELWTAPTAIGPIKGVGVLAILMICMPPATFELAHLFKAESVRPSRFISITASALLLLHGFLTQFTWFQELAASSFAFVLVFVILLAALRIASRKESAEAIQHMAGTLLATLYLGGLAWFMIALRVKVGAKIQGSTMLLAMFLLEVKFTDIGAYFGGRTFGRNKLIFWLSPGKTWEGLIFGLITAGAVGAICAPYVVKVNVVQGAVFGVIIGAVGQLGDLLESLMKRDAQVKDAGKKIPGFGGVLDVVDSPLVAAPVAYLLFSLL